MTSIAQPTEAQFCDATISKLARPWVATTVQQVIRNLRPAAHKSIQHNSAHPCIGRLGVLPTELLWMVLDSLDVQSLARLSRTSLLARSIIEQLPAYKLLMAYAPQTLTALGKTGLLQYHSAGQLRHALRSEHCVSCRTHYGGYLFLPTCERVCFECLRHNCALRVTTIKIAKECFRLTDGQVNTIPVMFSIPGNYSTGYKIRRNRVYRLVSIKQAKQLAIRVHGSAEAVRDL